jgi:hypothetical protein
MGLAIWRKNCQQPCRRARSRPLQPVTVQVEFHRREVCWRLAQEAPDVVLVGLVGNADADRHG